MKGKAMLKQFGRDAMRAAKRSLYLTGAATVGFLTLKVGSKLVPGNKDNELLAKAEEEALS